MLLSISYHHSGIMVVPIDDTDCLVKIRRQCRNVYSVTHISHVHFAPLRQPPPIPRLPVPATASTNAITTTTSGRINRFNVGGGTPLTTTTTPPGSGPAIGAAVAGAMSLVRLPPLLWAPIASRHKQFPKHFRDAVFVLLLASRHCAAEVKNISNGNNRTHPVAFPLHIWTYILSFASRDWFEPKKTEAQLLTEELQCERLMRSEAENQLKLALAARVRAEKERDMYRLMINQLHGSNHTTTDDQEEEEVEEGDEEEEEQEEEDEDEVEDDEDDDEVASDEEGDEDAETLIDDERDDDNDEEDGDEGEDTASINDPLPGLLPLPFSPSHVPASSRSSPPRSPSPPQPPLLPVHYSMPLFPFALFRLATSAGAMGGHGQGSSTSHNNPHTITNNVTNDNAAATASGDVDMSSLLYGAAVGTDIDDDNDNEEEEEVSMETATDRDSNNNNDDDDDDDDDDLDEIVWADAGSSEHQQQHTISVHDTTSEPPLLLMDAVSATIVTA